VIALPKPEGTLKVRLGLVLLALLVVVPAARADQPPYPVCAPAYAFSWHFGTTVYGSSPYVVALNNGAASYLELRAAHPRKSGRVLVKLWAERIGHATPGTTHAQLVPLKVTVTVRYTPGATPAWKTSVRLGWPKVKSTGATGGNVGFGGSSGDGSGSNAGGSGACVGC
jgi:uncharacterized membrane protein YgcG